MQEKLKLFVLSYANLADAKRHAFKQMKKIYIRIDLTLKTVS